MALPYVSINYYDPPHRRQIPAIDVTNRANDFRFEPILDFFGKHGARGVAKRTQNPLRERPTLPVEPNPRGFQAIKEQVLEMPPNPIYFGKTTHNLVAQLSVEPWNDWHYTTPAVQASQYLTH